MKIVALLLALMFIGFNSFSQKANKPITVESIVFGKEKWERDTLLKSKVFKTKPAKDLYNPNSVKNIWAEYSLNHSKLVMFNVKPYHEDSTKTNPFGSIGLITSFEFVNDSIAESYFYAHYSFFKNLEYGDADQFFLSLKAGVIIGLSKNRIQFIHLNYCPIEERAKFDFIASEIKKNKIYSKIIVAKCGLYPPKLTTF